MLPLELLGAPEGSCLVRACLDVESLTVHLATTAPAAGCPLCGYDSRRVHSRYTRRLDDLPCLGRCVQLQVAVRRFVCPESDCPRREMERGRSECAPCKGADLQRVQFLPGIWVAPAGSYRSGGGGNETVGAFETNVPRGGAANRQAVTRVNVEQASKSPMCAPTLH